MTAFVGSARNSMCLSAVIGSFLSLSRQSVARHPRAAGRASMALAGLLLSSALVPIAANAAGTATTTMPVSMTITAGCTVTATSVPFGTQSTLGAVTSAQGTVSATCTNTTPYNIGLDKGGGIGATTTVRSMTGPVGALINYGLFQNAGFTTNFGNTVGTDTLAGIGNGVAQTVTVYGRVPAQTSPAPGAYADVVNVTVTF